MRAFVALLLTMPFAFAAPPEGADPNSAMGQWYRSLERPDIHQSCCSVADCRPAQAIMSPGGWKVKIEDEWILVPPEKILARENPTGEAVVCYIKTAGVMCFIPPFVF